MKKILILISMVLLSCQSEIKENQPATAELQGETLRMYEKGEQLFDKLCSSCHHKDMKNKSTASALGGITERRTKKWLYDYVRNPSKMVRENDPQALEIHRKSNGILMQGFPNLTDEELDQIFFYIETTYQKNKIRLRPVER